MRNICRLTAALALMTALTAAARADSADEGNDLLCTRYGCAGGALTGTANAYNDAAPATSNLSTLGVAAGLDAAAPIPLLQDYGVGAQLAMSDGYYNWSGHTTTQAQQGYERQQFFSLGLFRRPDAAGPWWNRWGFGGTWDNMVDHAAGYNANNFTIRQFRLQASYDITGSHEVGIWRTLSGFTDHAAIQGATASTGYRAVDQMNVFYKYHLPGGGHLQAYVGPGIGGTLASNANHLFRYTWGADAAVPVNDYLGIFGGVSFAKASVTPAFSSAASAASNWSLSTGLSFFWGGNARSREDAGKHWMPYLSDPNNSNFMTQQSGSGPA